MERRCEQKGKKASMRPEYDTVLMIGSQQLLPVGNGYRFVIREVMPEKGFKFKFGIRDRILDEMIKRGKRLSVSFSDHPDLEIDMNPIEWRNKGEKKLQNGLFKNNPMKFYWYFVDFNGNLTNKKEAQGQLVL